jgi:hypothetical protein
VGFSTELSFLSKSIFFLPSSTPFLSFFYKKRQCKCFYFWKGIDFLIAIFLEIEIFQKATRGSPQTSVKEQKFTLTKKKKRIKETFSN